MTRNQWMTIAQVLREARPVAPASAVIDWSQRVMMVASALQYQNPSFPRGRFIEEVTR